MNNAQSFHTQQPFNHPSSTQRRRQSLSHIFIAMLTLISAMMTLMSEALAFRSGPLEVRVVDAQHNQLPSYHHRGGLYVMGRHQQRYMIKVTNHSAQRIEAVLTVDGRDVINGQPGAFRHRGYVVDPYETIEIDGFRRSATEVAAFRFTQPGDSYAGRMGAGENVGVIGLAAFSERRRRRVLPKRRAAALDYHESGSGYDGSVGLSAEVEPSSAAESAPAPQHYRSGGESRRRSRTTSSAPRSEIGTQYGERRHSASQETSFVRASSRPFTTLSVTYDSERGLRRRGVLRDEPSAPTAFPAESAYAPAPPGY